MTEDQADLVSKSFSLVLPISEVAASLFYSRLFEINPQLKPLFKSDMKEQGRKLMSTIGTAVAAARNPNVLVGPLENLALRHVKYGVKPEHFDDVGQALIWTLEQGLGPNFTPATRQAWVCLYGELVAIMLPKMTPPAGRPASNQAGKPAAHDGEPKDKSFFTSVASFLGWGR